MKTKLLFLLSLLWIMPVYGGVIAHRGLWQAGYPQNSIAGVEAALKSQYDGFEIDIRQTSDGILILNHDDTIGDNKVALTPYQELFIDDVAPALLTDMLELCKMFPAKTIFAEIKSGNANDIWGAFENAGVTSNVIFQSFDPTICREMMALTDSPVWLLSADPDLDFPYLQKEGFTGVSLMYVEGVTEGAFIDLIHSMGLKVAFWTVNDAATAEQLQMWGADYVITDLSSL